MNTSAGINKVTDDVQSGTELIRKRLLAVANYSVADVDTIVKFTSDTLGTDYAVIATYMENNRASIRSGIETLYILCDVLLAGNTDVTTLVDVLSYPPHAKDLMASEFLHKFFLARMNFNQNHTLRVTMKAIYTELNHNSQ